jgi:hypothetical protein
MASCPTTPCPYSTTVHTVANTQSRCRHHHRHRPRHRKTTVVINVLPTHRSVRLQLLLRSSSRRSRPCRRLASNVAKHDLLDTAARLLSSVITLHAPVIYRCLIVTCLRAAMVALMFSTTISAGFSKTGGTFFLRTSGGTWPRSSPTPGGS